MSAAPTPGKLVWFESVGPDAPALQRFYRDLFGWTLTEGPMAPAGYALSACEETGVPGGVGQAPGGSSWLTVYVEVADIKASVAQAAAAGAEVLQPVTELPSTFVAVVRDPAGHPIGLAQSKAA